MRKRKATWYSTCDTLRQTSGSRWAARRSPACCRRFRPRPFSRPSRGPSCTAWDYGTGNFCAWARNGYGSAAPVGEDAASSDPRPTPVATRRPSRTTTSANCCLWDRLSRGTKREKQCSNCRTVFKTQRISSNSTQKFTCVQPLASITFVCVDVKSQRNFTLSSSFCFFFESQVLLPFPRSHNSVISVTEEIINGTLGIVLIFTNQLNWLNNYRTDWVIRIYYSFIQRVSRNSLCSLYELLSFAILRLIYFFKLIFFSINIPNREFSFTN